MASDRRSPVLSIHDPLRFGKYAGVCPFDIWTGNPGHVDPQLASEILNEEVLFQGQQMTLKGVLATNAFESTMSYQLSEDIWIGELQKKLKEENLIRFVSERERQYVHAHRGEPGYIMWLINKTEYCFEPKTLELLGQTKYFAHTHLTIEKFALADNHHSFDVLPSNELQNAVIPLSLMEKNRLKFGG